MPYYIVLLNDIVDIAFYDISCVRVDSIFYRMLLLLISVCLRYLTRISLHRYKNMYTISSFYIISCAFEFREGLYYFGLIICFTMLSFSYIICFLGFWESLQLLRLKNIFYYITFLLYCIGYYYIFVLYSWVL